MSSRLLLRMTWLFTGDSRHPDESFLACGCGWLSNGGMLNLRSFLFAMLLLAVAPAAFAHARLVRSVPGKGEALPRPPAQIDLWFNELLDDGFNAIEIFPASEIAAPKRASLTKEKPVVDPRDRTHLTMKLPPLAPGEYVVEWRVLSRDGHSAPGRFTFRIAGR